MNSKFLIAALAIAGLLGGLALSWFGNSGGDTATQIQSRLKVATLLPADLKIFPEITLTDQNGKPFTRDSLKNKWQMIFFGYTHCPDICPMTMTILDKVDKLLKESGQDGNFQVVFISVDPTRDTPEHLQKYMAYFNPEFLGISADENALQTLSKSLGVVYQRVENEYSPADYLMDHSASLMLANPEGNIIALFSAPHVAEPIAADIRTISAAMKSY